MGCASSRREGRRRTPKSSCNQSPAKRRASLFEGGISWPPACESCKIKVMGEITQNMLPDRSGVYVIRNRIDGKSYVGSAVSLRKRWRDHKDSLEGRHGRPNPRLRNAWRKYGAGAFSFAPIIYCAVDDLLLYEQLAMDALQPEYNIRKIAESNIGLKWSAEVRERMGAPKRGVKRGPLSEELRAKLSAAHKGKRLSAGHRAKISEVQRGTTRGPPSKETRAKIAESNRGRKKSLETRIRISACKGGLADEQVREIRRRVRSGERTVAVAKDFGLHPTTVSKIKTGARYSWVTSEAA